MRILSTPFWKPLALAAVVAAPIAVALGGPAVVAPIYCNTQRAFPAQPCWVQLGLEAFCTDIEHEADCNVANAGNVPADKIFTDSQECSPLNRTQPTQDCVVAKAACLPAYRCEWNSKTQKCMRGAAIKGNFIFAPRASKRVCEPKPAGS